MRIIAGLAKGRRLFAPKSRRIRPAADKVKGSIFNILGPLDGLKVLDLFAGTGSVGLEAASRGADFVLLIDEFSEALKLIEKNATLCGFKNRATLLRGSIPSCLTRLPRKWAPFDLVFVDPPYDRGLVLPTLKALQKNKLIDAQSEIIIEHSPREMPDGEGFQLVDRRKYGQTFVSFLKCLRS